MKYWAYVNSEILGPFEKEKLLQLPSFSPALLVCPQTPVGEKTEDWKEASAYPELSAPPDSGPLPGPKAAPARENVQKNALGEPAPGMTLKPLASSPVEPVAPADHNFGGMDISVNRLGKAPASAPAPEPGTVAGQQPPQQTPYDFDPLTLSQVHRAKNVSGQETQAPNAEAAGASSRLFEAPKPFFTPGAAPELETFARPPVSASPAAAAAKVPVPAENPAADALVRKLDALAGNAVSRQDLSMALDPLRMKLDQLGEVISSIKNQQFQRDIMDKLAYLENAVGDIRTTIKQAPAAETTARASIAPAQVKDTSGRTIFGTLSQERSEKPKESPEKPGKIVDTGSKRSKTGAFFRKLIRLAATLALLAAVLLGAVIGLRNFGFFDATRLIPFQLPFVGKAQPPQPAAAPQPEPPPAVQAQAPQPAEQVQQPKAPDLSPEIIYFTRTYKAAPSGPTLEDKITEDSAAEGGDYNKVNWQVKPGEEGVFEIAAVIPTATAGTLTYTFNVDYAKKTLLPADERGKATFGALAPKPAVRAKRAGRAKKPVIAAAKQKPRPGKAKAAPAKRAAAQEDEYEYIYDEEDGTGQ